MKTSKPTKKQLVAEIERLKAELHARKANFEEQLASQRDRRQAAQRGLVINYKATHVLVEELKEAGLPQWIDRLANLGLYREIVEEAVNYP